MTAALVARSVGMTYLDWVMRGRGNQAIRDKRFRVHELGQADEGRVEVMH